MVQEDYYLLDAQTLYQAQGQEDTLCILSSVVSQKKYFEVHIIIALFYRLGNLNTESIYDSPKVLC